MGSQVTGGRSLGEGRLRAATRPGEARRRTHTARVLSRARACRGAVRERYENEAVTLNLDVALDVARGYHGRGIPDDDLDQVASLGLVKAARAFDPAVGEDFLSFAVPTVRGEIRRYFRDAGWTVRPPRTIQEAQGRVAQAEAELSQRLGREPLVHEIAEHLEVPVGLVRDSLAAGGCFRPVSLEAPRGSDPDDAALATLGDLDPAFASAEARVAVTPLLRDLDERERTIVTMRFYGHRTQAEIGEVVGVSQEQVSRLLSSILVRLRRSLEEAPGAARPGSISAPQVG